MISRRRLFAALAGLPLVGRSFARAESPASFHGWDWALPTDPKARLCRLKWLFHMQVDHQFVCPPTYPGEFTYAGIGQISLQPPPPSDAKSYEHLIVTGEGANEIEAIDDWWSGMPAGRWKTVFWRVQPELSYERHFDTQTTRWMVFSRFALVPLDA